MGQEVRGSAARSNAAIVDRIVAGQHVTQQEAAAFLEGLCRYLAGEIGVTNGAFRNGVISNM